MRPSALEASDVITILPPALQQDLLRQAREEAPREACGLLLGTVADAQVEVRELVGAKNLAQGTDSFEIDPGEVVRADTDARRRGLELVGFWHSHPRDEAVPSAADLRALWPGHVCVIVGPISRPLVRAWRVVDGRTVEIAGPSSSLGSGGLVRAGVRAEAVSELSNTLELETNEAD